METIFNASPLTQWMGMGEFKNNLFIGEWR